MNENDNFALVPRLPGALEKAEPGSKHILSGMVADTLTLVRKTKSQLLRIIVVDDDDDWLKFVEAMIQDWFKDAETVTFNSSQAALRELEQRDPDLLITGDKMPRMTGEELVRRLIAKNVNYPILVLTGHDEAQQWVREYASRGFNVGFQPKRGVEHELKRSIEESLNLQRGTIEKSAETAPQPRKSRPLRIIMVCSEPAPFQSLEFVIRLWFKDATFRLFQDNGQEAWQELSRTDPDLLIMADAMPVLRGEEIGRRLLDRKATYPIIVTSPFDPTEDWVRDFASRGLNVRFLAMPFTIEDVRKLLELSLKIPLDKKHEQ